MVQKLLSSFLKSVLSQKNKERKFRERRKKKGHLKKKKGRSKKNLKNDMSTNHNKVSNVLELNPEKTEIFFKTIFHFNRINIGLNVKQSIHISTCINVCRIRSLICNG